jgi:hypothetical protein
MGALKHIVGAGGIAITIDFFLFNGFCTDTCNQLLSQTYATMLSELLQVRTYF